MGFTRLGIGLFSAGDLIFLTGLVFTLTTIWNGIYPLTDYKTVPLASLKPKTKLVMHKYSNMGMIKGVI
jgi:hypothetical protein